MNDALLTKYLLQELSPQEREEVEKWLSASTENRRHFQQLETIWCNSKVLAQQQSVDADAAWERFKTKRDAVKEQHTTSTPMLKSFAWLRTVAAVLLLSIGAAWGTYSWLIEQHHPYFSTLTWKAQGEVRKETLPDGTEVTLNKNAEVAYTESLWQGKRLVKMKGEAFFQVQKDMERPFEIQVNDIEVQVLGTSFNIKEKGDDTEVIVESGAVQLRKLDVVIRLQADETASTKTAVKDFIKRKRTDSLYDYYRSNEFKLNGTPLWRAVEVLSEAYGIRIVIADKRIANLPLSTTFQREQLDTILHTIAQTLNVSVEKRGNTFILK
ncbi:FecR domain-containing protein [Olivibacter sitiensis]|uniref:FecR domain-containing protein n=1 Tax=Olivibacter sitiensis TaxID=376470 RepID=UPI00040CFB2D|nr:FecR domain-containing protein [Olivibacter sitiensis]